MPNIDKIRVNGIDYNVVAPEIYDDQERVIGTWFGKPLYRKVIEVNQYSGNFNVIHNIENLDYVTNFYGTFKRKDGVQTVTTAVAVDNYNIKIFDMTSTQFSVNVGQNLTDNLAVEKCMVTLEYTKTTD